MIDLDAVGLYRMALALTAFCFYMCLGGPVGVGGRGR